MTRFIVPAVLAALIHPAHAQMGSATEIVQAHNGYRAAARVPPVVWDDGLAAQAASWAAHLGRTGQLQHSPAAQRPNEGENLWMGTAGSFSATAAVAGWGAERRDFTGGVFPDVSRTGHFSAVAHYTQIVWRATHRIGCAAVRSGRWDILVCRYSSPGNVVGQAVY